ncbi:MAG TPA: SDR family oxidoreductase [Verrucomicrobiae bacterium]|nr:SDR family oxidoreductase [Verrucomicrobiae bacterium]
MSHKIAIITGGSRGIGKAIALRLAKAGVDSIVTYKASQAGAGEVVKQIEALGARAVAVPLDVAARDSYMNFAAVAKTALAGLGATKFDFLVNNAGIGLSQPFAETTEAQFDEMMHVHFRSVFFLSQTLLPLIADGGQIVNISTGTSRFVLPGYSIYASLKTAVEGLTRYMAKELGPRKIRVNVVAPGATETDFRDGFIRSNPQFKKMIESNIALGRVGQADDIAGVVNALLSDDGYWINGQRIEASGGQML